MIHASLQRDGVDHDMDWYCPAEHSRKGLRYPSDMTDREWL
jgi:hypothetical protein